MAETGIGWDDKAMREAMAQAPLAFRRHMISYALQAGNETKARMIQNTPGKDGGEGTLAASWQVLLEDKAEAVKVHVRSSAKYAKYVNDGRGPGKMPPYDSIEKWVHRLGLGDKASGAEREEGHEAAGAHKRTAYSPKKARPARSKRRERGTEELDREQIIFLIRRKIATRGTEPTKFVEATQKSMERRVEDLYKQYVQGFVDALNE